MISGVRLRTYVRVATYGLCVAAGVGSPARAQSPAAQPPTTQPIPLREAQPQTATHSAAARFSYDLEVAEPATYIVRVEQRGLDLRVAVTTPGGVTESYNSPTFRDGAELVVLESGPGRYRVEVFSEESTNAAGGHLAALTRLPPGVDARERDALRLMSAGGAANFAGGEQGWERAVASYERAAALWHELGRTREEADALFAVAAVEYWQRFAWTRSAELAARVAATYGELGEAALRANALHLQGAAVVEQALESKQAAEGAAITPESQQLFAEALTLLEQARAIHEGLGDVHDLAAVVNNFGYTYYNKGELDRARGYFERAATLFDSVGDWGDEVQPLGNIAALDADAGRLTTAIATFERILTLLPPGKLPGRRSAALNNLGATYLWRGDTEQALQTLASALALQRETGSVQDEGRSLRRIGEAYHTLGELELASQYLQQALPIAERTNDGRNQEATLRNLGNVAFLEHDYSGALAFHRRALEISASTYDRAHLQLLVAKDLVALGHAAEAKAAAAEAEKIARSMGSDVLLAGALNAVGRAQVLAGDPAAALATLASAAATFERLGLRTEHAEALHGLSLAARAAGRIDAALDYGEKALRELEAMRLRVADPELRAFFVSTRRDYFETQIELLMARAGTPGAPATADEHARTALQVSERGRARMISDLLQEAAIDLRDDSGGSLQAKERALYDELADRRRQRDILLERAGAGERVAADLERIVAQLAALENDLNLVEIELRRGNPKYAKLTAPATLTAAEIQAALGPDTVLLQYALGTNASWVWAVTGDRIVTAELADRATIEAAAQRALARLKTHTPDAGTSAAPPPELAELAALVIAPVAAHLDRPRVVLALDGALQFVPFAVLPVRGPDGSSVPLLAEHEVVEIPSMSALALSAHEPAPATRKTLAVFADPVLDASDPRFGSVRPTALVAAAQTEGVAARSSVGVDLGRLLSTGYEGEAIAALVPDERRLLARGFAANRDAVLHSDLREFRYIHFATHGLVDSRYPGLSALVLSQFDERGRPQDGFLRLNDIYNLKLGADLVVLSACDTALGREVRGEGLIGLTQGFMSAGARALVASLWQVPDRATAELMQQFYRYMLDEKLKPAAALRKAQLWSASQRRWSDPYFWGGFVLVGDWR
ncbi:MAG TPA: CHAT domain-containing tetratricopeptide repeat protein [Gammaproteobacteria bacterium]|nr:CHAT domain-containing tetratricopeptide repeat protein [Gammaproteobacteria bacterium]